MRTAFIKALVDYARADKRIFLLVGDLGYSVVEPLSEEFPDRFINVGVAEQNMTGVAAGLALSGKIVFTYSIANFPTLRCLEQIRNDVCYHEANVKIIAIGGGFSYGAQGVTHHGTEDLAIMRVLPNMCVVAPGDPVETALATRAIVERPGPCYLRLGKAREPVVHAAPPDFQLGRAITVKHGDDITVITTGGMLFNVMQAAEQLEQHGISVRVLSMHTLKPLDIEAVMAAAKQTGRIIAVEEHSVIGGLGSAVADVIAESDNLQTAFKRLGIGDVFSHKVGSQDFLRQAHGLSLQAIIEAVREMVSATGD